MQFIFRRVTSSGEQINFSLGSWYKLAKKKTTEEGFHEMHEMKWGDNVNHDAVAKSDIAYLYSEAQEEAGINPYLLTSSDQNYIMTDSGKTFESVS